MRYRSYSVAGLGVDWPNDTAFLGSADSIDEAKALFGDRPVSWMDYIWDNSDLVVTHVRGSKDGHTEWTEISNGA